MIEPYLKEVEGSEEIYYDINISNERLYLINECKEINYQQLTSMIFYHKFVAL